MNLKKNTFRKCVKDNSKMLKWIMSTKQSREVLKTRIASPFGDILNERDRLT